MAGWRRWLLAMTLCLFALGYGAPTSLAAHATMPHAAMASGCPDAGGHQAAGTPKSDAGIAAACCIAHCLPALVGPVPPGAAKPAPDGATAAPCDEDGEGWAAPVLLPPPRG